MTVYCLRSAWILLYSSTTTDRNSYDSLLPAVCVILPYSSTTTDLNSYNSLLPAICVSLPYSSTNADLNSYESLLPAIYVILPYFSTTADLKSYDILLLDHRCCQQLWQFTVCDLLEFTVVLHHGIYAKSRWNYTIFIYT